MEILLDESLDLPIYRQISDRITSEVRSGRLSAGSRLPTVRKLAEELGIARGTIKRAYDELESCGIISKARGRGSFVSWTDDSGQSRKEKAMQAIDAALDSLEKLRFTPTEIAIFWDLRVRQRLQREYSITVRAVECCRETVAMLRQSLYAIEGIEVLTGDVYEAVADPESIINSADLVVTTPAHMEIIGPLAERGRVMPVAMELSHAGIGDLMRLGKSRAGILAYSGKFAAMAASFLETYAPSAKLCVSKVEGDEQRMDEVLRNIDALLIPAGYHKMGGFREEGAIRAFAAEHMVVELGLKADAGSLIYIGEKVRDMQHRKRK